MSTSFASRSASTLTPADFRQRVQQVAPSERDAWWNEALSLDEVPDDSHELPRGCVPYMPSPVDALLRTIEYAPVTESDVFVDVGCGTGRAALFIRLATGAQVVGVDVQSRLVNIAWPAARYLGLSNVQFLVADACEQFVKGSVYFLYCPFGAERVRRFLSNLREHALTRQITIVCLDLQLPACEWIVQSHEWPDLRLYRSVPKQRARARSMEPIPGFKQM